MAIRQSTIKKMEKFVSEADIDLLKRLLSKDKWVIGHSCDADEISAMNDEEIREWMIQELYEDSDYVQLVIPRVNYYVRKTK